MPRAYIIEAQEMVVLQLDTLDTIKELSIPKIIPINPPVRLKTEASIINWERISVVLAPIAFRNPISRVLSVTETNMIFMIPMPPTKREIPEIITKKRVMLQSGVTVSKYLGVHNIKFTGSLLIFVENTLPNNHLHYPYLYRVSFYGYCCKYLLPESFWAVVIGITPTPRSMPIWFFSHYSNNCKANIPIFTLQCWNCHHC